MYYNTNKETGITLEKSKVKTKTQEDIVLNIFVDKSRLTASETWKIYNKKKINKRKLNTPITSIRRAITNLCDEGKLTKTADTNMGRHGKKEHIYQLL